MDETVHMKGDVLSAGRVAVNSTYFGVIQDVDSAEHLTEGSWIVDETPFV